MRTSSSIAFTLFVALAGCASKKPAQTTPAAAVPLTEPGKEEPVTSPVTAPTPGASPISQPIRPSGATGDPDEGGEVAPH